MYKYVAHKDIDKEKWNRLLDKIPYAHFYALYQYLTAICSWDAIIEENNEQYETIVPLPFKKKFGIKYVYQPFFCQQLGIFSLHQKLDTELVFALIKKHFTFGKFQWHNKVNNYSFYKKENPNYTLNLNSPYLEITNNYNKNRKRILKKATLLDLEMTFSETNESIVKTIDLFRDLLGPNFMEIEPRHYKNLALGLQSIQGIGKVQTGILKSKNSIISTVLIVEYKDRINYLLGFTDNTFKKAGVQSLLFNKIISDNSESNKVMDFEGSKIDGIAQFYKSFGAQKEIYHQFTYRSYIYKILKRIR